MVKCETADVCFCKKIFSFPERAFQETQRNTDRGTATKEADEWATVTGVLLSVVMDASRMDVDGMWMPLLTAGS